MNSDVQPTFKKLLMGHSVGLDEVYYDKNSDKSKQKLFQEYCRAIDLLTIGDSMRLKVKVEELTAKNESNEYIIKRKRLSWLSHSSHVNPNLYRPRNKTYI